MNAIKEAHYNLGIAYLEAGQYDRAIREFEATIKLDASFIGAHCALCRAYLEQDELEKAGTAVTAALALDATHQPALLLHGTITEVYHDKGKAYLDDRRYIEAIEAFQKAIDLDTDLGNNSQKSPLENTHIYAHLGAAYIGMKAYQDAIDALQNAIALDSDLVDAHYNLGHAYIEQGHPDKAIPHLERAVAIAPNLKRAHYNLARAYRESGNLEAATHTVTETLRIDPNYRPAHELADRIKQAHYNIGITYLNDDRYSEAVTAFQSAITLASDFTTAHYNLGLTFLKMESYPRAVDTLQKTITLDPTYVAAHHSLALAYLGQQELGKARNTAREALKLDPDYQPVISLLEAIDPSFTRTEEQTPPQPEPDSPTDAQQQITPRQEMHYELGIVYRDAKRHTEAIAEFQQAIDLDPNFVAAHISLGEVYLEMGRLDEAENAANAALKIDANSQPARQLLDAIKQARPTPIPTKSPGQTTALDIPDTKRDLERGMVFLNNRQYNQAAAAFKRVIKVDPNSVEAHYGLGQAYLGIEAFDDAQAAANEVVRRNPNHPPTRELIQLIKFARNREQNRGRRKTILRYAAILSVIVLSVFVGIWFGVIPWPAPTPPIISIAASLEEPSGNDFLDADETGYIRLTISNKGGTARNVELRFQPRERTSFAGLMFIKPTLIPELKKNSIETIRIRVTAAKKIQGREQSLQVQLLDMDKTFLATKDFTFKIIPQTPKPDLPRGR